MDREKVWMGLGMIALAAVIAMAIFLLKLKMEYLGKISGIICLSLLVILDSVAIREWIRKKRRKINE